MNSLTRELTFVLDELWSMAWAASVQRAKVFVEGPRSNADFRTEVTNYVRQNLLFHYEQRCTEEQHYRNIASLVEFGGQILSTPLRDGIYKYGVAQKLLNLALKYYWCLGLIPEPPHCPIDRIIIAKTHLRDRINWTEIRNESEYRDVIDAIRKVAHGESLARWELANYERQSTNSRKRRRPV